MKFAIFFVFVAFAFLAQTNAKSVSVVDVSVDRGAIAEALKTKLAEAKRKLAEMLNKAQDVLKQKIIEAQKQAELLIDQFRQKANEISDHVYEAAQKFLDKVGQFEDKVMEQANKIINGSKNEVN